MNIRDFFQFEAVGRTIEELETPVPVIDIGIADRNLRRWQARCDQLGLANRPHIKTHKLVPLAKYQLALGGDLVRVTPNHVCPVINLFDKIVFVDGNDVLGAVKVDARGAVQ